MFIDLPTHELDLCGHYKHLFVWKQHKINIPFPNMWGANCSPEVKMAIDGTISKNNSWEKNVLRKLCFVIMTRKFEEAGWKNVQTNF